MGQPGEKESFKALNTFIYFFGQSLLNIQALESALYRIIYIFVASNTLMLLGK